MRVLEKKRRKLICKNCELADDSISRAKGLMFSMNRKNILFIFDDFGKHPIHSFFVFHEFHAVYLDWNMRVVQVSKITPFTTYHESSQPARYLLEICDGKVPQIGDLLCLDGKS